MSHPQFVSPVVARLQQRSNKVETLRKLNNVDSRRVRKEMNVHVYGKTTNTNVKGFFGKRKPVKCSVKGKTRHTTYASKSIMRYGGA